MGKEDLENTTEPGQTPAVASKKPRAPRKPKDTGPSHLIALHNLSQANLLHADQLGGLASPSLALVHPEHAMDNFGEVTLVAHPSMVDPEQGTPVFAADAYSPRHPRARYAVNDKRLSAFTKWLEPHVDKTDGYTGDLRDHVNEEGVAGLADHSRLRHALMSAYLEEHGKRVPAVMKRAQPERLVEYARQPAMDAFVQKWGTHSLDDDPARYEALNQAVHQAVDQHAAEFAQQTGDPEDAQYYKDSVQKRQFGDDDKIHGSYANMLLRNLARMHEAPRDDQVPYHTQPALEEFKAKHGVDVNARPGTPYYEELSRAARTAVDQYAAEQYARHQAMPEDKIRGWYAPHFNPAGNLKGQLAYVKSQHLLQALGREPGSEIDKHATQDRVEDAFRALHGVPPKWSGKDSDGDPVRTKLTPAQEQAQAAAEQKLHGWVAAKAAGIQGAPYLPKYTDGPNGLGERKIPYNLENILREMTKKVADGEGFNYGLGNARALGAKRFRSLDDIRQARKQVVSKEQFEKVKKTNDERFAQLCSKLENHHEDAHRVMESLAGAIGASYKRGHYLYKEMQDHGFRGVPEHLRREVADFATDLLALPTEYFEAKPQRAVGLNEFKGAAVPHDARPETLDVLRRHGITHVERYKRNDPKDRARAVRTIAEQKDLLLSEREVADLLKAHDDDLETIMPPEPVSETHAPAPPVQHPNTPEFQTWFQGSKAVDAQGAPLTARFKEHLTAQGHDGIVLRNTAYDGDGTPSNQYVVFHPSQVKSAFNRTWDPNNPEFGKSEAVRLPDGSGFMVGSVGKTEDCLFKHLLHDDPSTPVTLYRVQGPTGHGPYSDEAPTPVVEAARAQARAQTRHVRTGKFPQPMPQADFAPGEVSEMGMLHGDPDVSAYQFAFERPEHAEQWFGRPHLDTMAQHGWTLQPVQAARAYRSASGRQVAYLPFGKAEGDATPMSLPYSHRRSLTPTPNLGETFNQHLEPAGKYLSYHDPSWPRAAKMGQHQLQSWYEYGTVHFKNPLVHQMQPHENLNAWKAAVSAAHGNRTGRVLSNHLRKLGHDGIVVRRSKDDGWDGEISEMVNLGAPEEVTHPFPEDVPDRRVRGHIGKGEDDLTEEDLAKGLYFKEDQVPVTGKDARAMASVGDLGWTKLRKRWVESGSKDVPEPQPHTLPDQPTEIPAFNPTFHEHLGDLALRAGRINGGGHSTESQISTVAPLLSKHLPHAAHHVAQLLQGSRSVVPRTDPPEVLVVPNLGEALGTYSRRPAGHPDANKHRITLDGRTAVDFYSAMTGGVFNDWNYQAATTFTHEALHHASNAFQYEFGFKGDDSWQHRPSAALEEATTEVLARHLTPSVIKHVFGMGLHDPNAPAPKLGVGELPAPTAAQRQRAGMRPAKSLTGPLFQRVEDPYGKRTHEFAIADGQSPSYRGFVERFGNLVAYADDLHRQPQLTNREVSEHIARRALEVKQRPQHNVVDDKGITRYQDHRWDALTDRVLRKFDLPAQYEHWVNKSSSLTGEPARAQERKEIWDENIRHGVRKLLGQFLTKHGPFGAGDAGDGSGAHVGLLDDAIRATIENKGFLPDKPIWKPRVKRATIGHQRFDADGLPVPEPKEEPPKTPHGVASVLQDVWHYADRAAGTGDTFSEMGRGDAMRQAAARARFLGIPVKPPRNLRDAERFRDEVEAWAVQQNIDAQGGTVMEPIDREIYDLNSEIHRRSKALPGFTGSLEDKIAERKAIDQLRQIWYKKDGERFKMRFKR